MPEVILLVEDDAVVRSVVSRVLEDQHYEVVHTSTLVQARQILSTTPVSVALVDLTLPDGNGLDLLDYARRADANLPILVLTANTTVEVVVEAIRKGAFDYLEKPVERNRLTELVSRAIEQRKVLLRGREAARPFHVLVVEDDAVILRVMSNWLAEVGAIVWQASSLDEAVETLASTRVDLVVSDVYLEHGSGIDLAKGIKGHAPPPLVLVTAGRDRGLAISALRRGAFDFLQKPLDKEEFVNCVLRARHLQEMAEGKRRVEREREEFRVRLEFLSSQMQAQVRQEVEEATKVRGLAYSIYANLPAGIVITDCEGIVTAVNPAAEQLLQMTSDLLVGHRLSGLSHLARFAPTVDEALRTGLTYRDLEAVVRLAPDHEVLYGYLVAPLKSNDTGQVRGAFVHFSDITNRRRLEQYKTQTERLVSLGMLAGGMAHEVNNPLMVIVGWLEHLLDDPSLPDPVAEIVRKCLDAGIRCGNILRTMLGLSRHEESRLNRVDVHASLRRILALLEKQFGYHNIDVRPQLAATHPTVTADEREIEQLFLNLCLNAKDAMPHGGTLMVVTYNEARELGVRIADTGTGIDADHLPHIFTPFFTTKQVGQGTGLGLSICLSIAQRHLGRIHVSSEVGKGTTFTVNFPVTQTPVETPAPVETVPVRPLRVALVDDDPMVLEATQPLLTSAGHQVFPFESPTGCLSWLGENEVDLLVADVKMPEMSGVELYYRVHTLQPWVLTVFITGSLTEPRLGLLPAVDRSGVEVLRKPFRRDDLMRAIARLFGRGSRPEPAPPRADAAPEAG